MEKIALMFPGVGAQQVGMGKSFYDRYQVVRETLAEAGDVLKMDFFRLCFSKESENELNRLENAQLALVAVEVAFFRVYMQELGIEPHLCLGHSLGEYPALCSAGVISFPDTLTLVKERGRLLAEAASTLGGMMAWVINLDYKIVERVIARDAAGQNHVFVSAYDSPTQSSISGPRDAVLQVGRELEKEGAIVYPLKLSGPFHSPLMTAAADNFNACLRQFSYHPPRCPIIANQNASPYTHGNVVENLTSQLTRPVLWQESLHRLREQQVKTAVEIGPGQVLKHLCKNNSIDLTVHSFEKNEHLENLKKNLPAPTIH
jgi:[acyl-carrier-protein] S-malonyltransferase